MTEAVRQLKNSEDKRAALIEFKNSLKQGTARLSDDDAKYMITLLSNPDAKSRKNVAQILGIANAELSRDALIEKYENEETEFVKASYILAIKDMYIDDIKDKLEELRKGLSAREVTEENKKHIDEQMSAFDAILGKKIGKHTFTGYDIESDIILITQRGLGNLTADSFEASVKKVLNIGVSAKVDDLNSILELRTYKELLFTIPELKRVPDDPYKIAEVLAGGELRTFLKLRHDNDDPWSYRLSVVSSMDEKKKALFIKRFAGELMRHSESYFVNSASDYELEIRLLENREGGFTLMIKLFTIPDERFSYRKEVISAGIRPDLAANLVKLSADYIRPGVQVLDPFCGTGTMLIERTKYMDAYPLYGIDIFAEAIEKARINAEAAGVEINFINRDYFDFKHKYLFDEIFTNMPFSMNPEDADDINDLYRKFFLYSARFLKPNSFVIMYVRDIESAREYASESGYFLEKEVQISEKEGSYLCIYRYKG